MVQEPVAQNQQASLERKNLDLVELEERVLNCKGSWLYFTRYLNVDEEEMTKYKKSGIKGVDRSDIEPVHGRAWVDLTSFRNPGK